MEIRILVDTGTYLIISDESDETVAELNCKIWDGYNWVDATSYSIDMDKIVEFIRENGTPLG